MNRFNNLDYGFAVGVVRAFESKLIKPEEFLRLRACKNVSEFVFELKNIKHSAANFSDLANFYLKLNSDFCEVVHCLKRSCPVFAPFDVVFFENDCFNLKVVLMAKKQGFAYDKFLLKPGSFSASLFDENFSGLPEPFLELAMNLNELLNCGASNFKVCVEFNRQVFKKKLDLCRFSEFLFNRTRLYIDFYNFRLVLKAFGLKLREDALKEVLIDGGMVDCGLILKVFDEGVGSLNRLFMMCLNKSLNELLGEPDLFDEIVFNKVSDFEFSVSNLPFSFAAIVSYLGKLQHENKVLKELLAKLVLLN